MNIKEIKNKFYADGFVVVKKFFTKSNINSLLKDKEKLHKNYYCQKK